MKNRIFYTLLLCIGITVVAQAQDFTAIKTVSFSQLEDNYSEKTLTKKGKKMNHFSEEENGFGFLVGVGLNSPYGNFGVGVNYCFNRLQAELNLGLTAPASRISLGVNYFLTDKSSLGMALARTPASSTTIVIQNISETDFPIDGGEYISGRSSSIRFGGEILDTDGKRHDYIQIGSQGFAYYDLKDVNTIHFRYNYDWMKVIRLSAGYGINLNKPFEQTNIEGNIEPTEGTLRFLTAGGLEISAALLF